MGSRPILPATTGTMLNFDGHCDGDGDGVEYVNRPLVVFQKLTISCNRRKAGKMLTFISRKRSALSSICKKKFQENKL